MRRALNTNICSYILCRHGGMSLLIAAHALAEVSVVITNNAREFLRVPGLAIEAWALTWFLK